MSISRDLCLITPTWAGDAEHFRLLRASIERSPLSELTHQVVIQTEDLPLFTDFRNRPNLQLLSTAEVLPANIEQARLRAKQLSQQFGRHLTRICGSMSRSIGWPRWPAYTGWHTQQLCKLQLAAQWTGTTAVAIDSDVIVTPSASVADFMPATGNVRCFATWQTQGELRGKVLNWVNQASSLICQPLSADSQVNNYFDTPFVLDRKMVNGLFAYLEAAGKPWWQVMLSQPPRRWSEFGTYKAFLGSRSGMAIDWKTPDFTRYIYDTSNPQQVLQQVQTLLADDGVHYITIHSQSSGKQDWDACAYLGPLTRLIESRLKKDSPL